MKKSLHNRIHQQLAKEEIHEVNLDLLDELRSLASEQTDYFDLDPERINTFNQFFREVKTMFLEEVVKGNYGADVVLDAVIVLCFEVGYKLREREQASLP